mmetsp:Transcript_22836/g.17277  ORF Transcript_22836/g.17277 Transcript_22836/m.17277 type:complete len:222 (+) Transcript_22836:397-1062(+)
MGDDGSGSSITIPSFFIRKRDADKIKAAMVNSHVYVQGEVEMTHPDNRVEYDLWFSSILDLQQAFIMDFSTYMRTLGSFALFTPRIFTYNCKYCPEEVKQKNCIYDGEYCAFLPRTDLPKRMQGVTGREFLREAIRARCLYNTMLEETGEGQNFFMWWNYILNFDLICNDYDHFTEKCAELQMHGLGLDADKTRECLKQSFEGEDFENDNKYLREDRKIAV